MNNITLELVEEIFRISRIMKDEMSFSSALMNLTALQFHALIYLAKHSQTTMSDIAKYFRIKMPSATSLIRVLINQHLVERKENENDRRLVIIQLSGKGKALVQQLLEKRRKSLEAKVSFLSKKDQCDLLKILKNLHGQLEK